ncbi:uncharacterized protein LOC134233178 isoform X2 [Saccostrea cucullata]|uniref:uncharacterized protein LOC134233178 isoform X2 n=1 Tax=Saccostrea cuccullata TaxID=36930 RepID=UPI002ED3036F
MHWEPFLVVLLIFIIAEGATLQENEGFKISPDSFKFKRHRERRASRGIQQNPEDDGNEGFKISPDSFKFKRHRERRASAIASRRICHYCNIKALRIQQNPDPVWDERLPTQ